MNGREPGFVARYPDHCLRCGHEIRPGQRVVRSGPDHLIHVGCASGQDDK